MKDFDAQVSQGPRVPHDGGVPTAVRYHRCCGEVCRLTTPLPRLAVYHALLRLLCAGCFKSCADLVKEAPIFAIWRA